MRQLPLKARVATLWWVLRRPCRRTVTRAFGGVAFFASHGLAMSAVAIEPRETGNEQDQSRTRAQPGSPSVAGRCGRERRAGAARRGRRRDGAGRQDHHAAPAQRQAGYAYL